MGKASKQRKKTRAVAAPYIASPAKILPTPTPTDESDDVEMSDCDELDPIDLMTTLDTLNFLLERPALLKSAEHKQTRSIIHKIHGVLGIGAASITPNPETELIAALRNRDHPRARALLATIKTPKLGSLQRWVRECDAANVADPKDPEAYKDQQSETWKTLEAIIRTTMGETKAPEKPTLTRFTPWEVSSKAQEDRIQIYKTVKAGKIACKSLG